MRKKRNNKKKIHTGHGGQSQQMEKDKRKQTESEGSAAADVEAEDQEEPPVADGEGTRRRTRSDEDDNGEALGPRKRWRATTGEEKKSKYSAREDEALLASVQAFCSVRHNHNHDPFCFVLFVFVFVVVGINSVDAVALARLQAAGLGSTEEAVYRFIENKEWKNHRGCWIEIGKHNVPRPACGRAWAGIIRLRACMMTRHIGCWLLVPCGPQHGRFRTGRWRLSSSEPNGPSTRRTRRVRGMRRKSNCSSSTPPTRVSCCVPESDRGAGEVQRLLRLTAAASSFSFLIPPPHARGCCPWT